MDVIIENLFRFNLIACTALLLILVTPAASTLAPSNQPEAYFNGSTYLRLQTPISLKEQIGISFRTCIGGILFRQQQSDDTIELSVRKDGVVFQGSTGGKEFIKSIDGDFFDNRWHTVSIQYRMGNVTLRVDKQSTLLANATDPSDLLATFGSHNEGRSSVLLVGQRFFGCLIEGPSLVFSESSRDVKFGKCPMPEGDDSCMSHDSALEKANFCATEPCMRHGTCINNKTGYTCLCLDRYTGKNCEIDRGTPCNATHSNCQNGATCTVDQNGEYVCFCSEEYTGRLCEHEIDIRPPCELTTCKNGGTCFVEHGQVQCRCLPGFSGVSCEVSHNVCERNPCRNNGSCIDVENSYTCDCRGTGYEGRHCERNINECLNHPCGVHGTCFDNPGSYLCQCKRGFTGDDCKTPVSECMSQPCLHMGTCIERPPNGFACICRPGYSGERCELDAQAQQRPCGSAPCSQYGECAMEGNSVPHCVCKDIYPGTYPDCQVDGVCANSPCKNGATCTPWEGTYNCTCPPGYKGAICNQDTTCLDSPCLHAISCQDYLGGYFCSCLPGWNGLNCDMENGNCDSTPCRNGATCRAYANTYICHCPDGFTGAKCDVDIDECLSSSPDYCNKGICVNNVGGFQCYCTPGYTGERCDVDFNECLSNPCKNNATCLDKINNFECVCPPGYEGKTCAVDINECQSDPCAAGSTCVDGINEFTCICQPGMTGPICDINIDDCESSPCMYGGLCIDGLNNYTCDCTDTGYMGAQCETNIDDCIGNPCLNGAPCIDQVKDYFCECFAGYTGKNCEDDINECENNPCKYEGTCLQKSNMTLYNPSVVSQLNTTLPEFFNRPFNYATAEGYACICVPGVTGESCEININECESNPCEHGNCIDEIGSYFCECEEGYEGQYCEHEIDECEKFKPCIHGKCIDKKANYYCDCEPKYGGKNCSVLLTGCVNNPCKNKGSCNPYVVNEVEHKFNCSCSNGFHGHTCETISTMSLSGNSQIMVNTVREEGYDIQFRFKTTLGDGILALGKGLTYFILELSKGRLNLHSSLLNKWEGAFIGSNLNNSDWQRVFVAINSTHIVVSANDEQSIYPINYVENNNVTHTVFPTTYIAGAPNSLRKIAHFQPFFVGCIEDLLINGEWVLPKINTPGFDNIEIGCSREPQCQSNPCHSNGHCTDLWRDFSCTCERPYLGHTCQYNYTAATFGYENITDSLVTIDVFDSARRAIRTIVDISMFIKTRQSKGQIFYLGSVLGSANAMDETYIAAQLESGELLVRIQFNGTPEAYTVGGVRLNNGYNHLIEVIRNVTLVQVKLNGTEYFRKTISATGTLDAQVLYLGGQPQLRPVRQANDNLVKEIIAPTAPAAVTTPLSSIHFKGIIQDVQISNGSSIMIVEFFPLRADDLEVPLVFGNVSFDHSTVLDGVRSDNSCRINPCQRGGTCENTWNDYRCLCPRGFKGKDCTDVEFCQVEKCPNGFECKNLDDGFECIADVSFNGITEPWQYRSAIAPDYTKTFTDTSIELTYRTRSWGTLLLAKNKQDYFVVFIYHNEVVVEWVLGTATDMRRFRRDHFDGQWLTLLFTYKEGVFKGGFKEYVLDEAPSFEIADFDFDALTRLFSDGIIYVAGSDGATFDYHVAIDNYNMTEYVTISDTTTAIPSLINTLDVIDTSSQDSLYKIDQNKKTDAFKGCIREVRFGGFLFPLYSRTQDDNSSAVFELISNSIPDLGCKLCYDNDCFNQGFCVNSTETYKCNCTEGYTADDCSIDINECENNQCQNNATCVDLVAKYECKCLPGYDGDFCQNDIDECLSNPCRNGGTCMDLIGNFKCECPEKFVGKQCEAPLLITCENKPCKEGATCKTGPNLTTGNNFTCVCSEGMEGIYCDTPFCIRQHCENGHCNTTEEVPYCQCQIGFSGTFCEINIDDCVLSSGLTPCQNGGQCIDGINRYDCNCTGTGYTGLLCEMDVNECKNPNQCGNGRCVNTPGSFMCYCDVKGKCGQNCSLDDPCVLENPCEHGFCESRCSEKPDYFCNCTDGYTGKNCTTLKLAASESESGLNILYIIIPIVLLVLIGFLIGMAVLVNVARSKRATRGTYSPSAQEFCNPRVELDHVLKPPPEERLI